MDETIYVRRLHNGEIELVQNPDGNNDVIVVNEGWTDALAGAIALSLRDGKEYVLSNWRTSDE